MQTSALFPTDSILAVYKIELSNEHLHCVEQADPRLQAYCAHAENDMLLLCFPKTLSIGVPNEAAINPRQVLAGYFQTMQAELSASGFRPECTDLFSTAPTADVLDAYRKTGAIPTKLYDAQLLLNLRQLELDTLQTLSALDKANQRMIRMIEGLKNQMYGEVWEAALQAQRTAQAQVTGLSYGLLTTSMVSMIAYTIDDLRCRAEQQKRANAAFEQTIAAMHNSASWRLLQQYEEYKRSIFTPMVAQHVTAVFRVVKTRMILDLYYGNRIRYLKQ